MNVTHLGVIGGLKGGRPRFEGLFDGQAQALARVHVARPVTDRGFSTVAVDARRTDRDEHRA